MAFATRVTRMLDIQHPILLAPMDQIAGGRLASAVSQAGGLGLLGCAYGNVDWLEREWAAAGNSRIGCGFITWSLAKDPSLLDRALAHRPAAVMLSFGDPGPFAGAIREAGATLICQVQSLAQAREAVAAGADILVAQGTEAGGHGQTTPLLSLLADIVRDVPGTPVVADGGIADGRGLVAALAHGAEGVLMGTRFYASQEANGHPAAKQRIVDAGAGDTVRSIVFDLSRRIDWPAEFTGRAIRNRHATRWVGREDDMRGNLDDIARDYADARERGDFDIAAVIAGESCALIDDIPTAGEIVERVVTQAEAIVATLSRGEPLSR
jgi:nitronate monooxygenase